MPPRFKSGFAIACLLLALYIVFWRDEPPFEGAEHPIQVFPNDWGNPGIPSDNIVDFTDFVPPPPPNSEPPPPPPPPPPPAPAPWNSDPDPPVRTRSENIPSPTKAPQGKKLSLNEQYAKEYKALGEKEGVGAIYGHTLKTLVEIEAYKGLSASKLSPVKSGSWRDYSTIRPFKYSPYPDYNGKTWKTKNRGEYRACNGPNGPIEDVIVWSGDPSTFPKPGMGSWAPLDVDNGLCFERETRLGPYGFVSGDLSKRAGFENANWGQLQESCVEANLNRFPEAKTQDSMTLPPSLRPENTADDEGNLRLMKRAESEEDAATENYHQLTPDPAVEDYQPDPVEEQPTPDTATEEQEVTDSAAEDYLPDSASEDATPDPAEKQVSAQDPAAQDYHQQETPDTEDYLQETPKLEIPTKNRTAVVIRTSSGQEYTEDDKQNIRSLVSELCLRSGGEYQVYLLVHIKEDLPLWTDTAVYAKALEDNVPNEFRSMAVLWNNAQMNELYQPMPEEINDINQSQWLPIQKFAMDHPEFDFIWNWEFDARYTGHHYDLLEKLSTWSKKQPRQGLWERNERFFIPDRHASYQKFLETLKNLVKDAIIWGAVPIPKLTPSGPAPPVDDPKDDNYKWGVGEDADYISLAPIFDPVGTTWPAQYDIWGYAGEDTPRRATIGGHARCSRQLLDRMNVEIWKGNHIGPDMAPATVSLLHGFKAVFAPIPVYFDREWPGKSLQRYFNTGSKGVTGGTKDSPFSEGNEKRFEGSTWYYGAETPMRLWNNWLGFKDAETGGPEWEQAHGRPCLPPMLLRLSTDTKIPPLATSSELETPDEVNGDM